MLSAQRCPQLSVSSEVDVLYEVIHTVYTTVRTLLSSALDIPGSDFAKASSLLLTVMYCMARTHFANRSPEGEALPLTPRQLYDGLKIKARDPGEFISLIEQCKVISEGKTTLLREVKFKNKVDPVQERVEFFEPMTAEFTMLSPTGETVGRVTNVVSTTPDGEVLLTFTFAIGGKGQEGNDPAGDEHAKSIFSEADAAIAQTIKLVRKLVKEGKL